MMISNFISFYWLFHYDFGYDIYNFKSPKNIKKHIHV